MQIVLATPRLRPYVGFGSGKQATYDQEQKPRGGATGTGALGVLVAANVFLDPFKATLVNVGKCESLTIWEYVHIIYNFLDFPLSCTFIIEIHWLN